MRSTGRAAEKIKFFDTREEADSVAREMTISYNCGFVVLEVVGGYRPISYIQTILVQDKQ